MTDEQIAKLEKMGFVRWTKGNSDRLYIKSYRVKGAFKIKKNLSKTQAFKFDWATVYIDLTKDDKIVVDAIKQWMEDDLRAGVAEMIAETVETEKKDAFEIAEEKAVDFQDDSQSDSDGENAQAEEVKKDDDSVQSISDAAPQNEKKQKKVPKAKDDFITKDGIEYVSAKYICGHLNITLNQCKNIVKKALENADWSGSRTYFTEAQAQSIIQCYDSARMRLINSRGLLTSKTIAECLFVSLSTYYRWRRKHNFEVKKGYDINGEILSENTIKSRYDVQDVAKWAKSNKYRAKYGVSSDLVSYTVYRLRWQA